MRYSASLYTLRGEQVTLPAVVILLGAAIWLHQALLEYPLGRGRMGSRNWLIASCAIIACGCNLAVLSAVGLTPLAIGLRLISLIFPFALGTAFLWHTAPHMVRTSGPVGRRIVIATSDPSCGLIDRVRICPGHRPEIVGIFLLGRTAHVDSSVVSYLEAKNADTLIIVTSPKSRFEASGLAEQAAVAPVNVFVAGDGGLGVDTNRFTVSFAGSPMLRLRRRPLTEAAVLVKRSEDLLVASLALILLAPVILVVAIAICIETPGPILFCQRRHGLNGKEFNLLKFRTMHCHLPITRLPDRRRRMICA